jgi:hypothetical protein
MNEEDDDLEITEADLEEAAEIFDRVTSDEDPQWANEEAGEEEES